MILYNKTSIAVCMLAIAALTSCRDAKKYPGYEYFPDMYRGPAYETYAPSNLSADSVSARKPAEGSIPRGFIPFNYATDNAGYEKAGMEAINPLEANKQNLEEGKRLYNIYCANCHGSEGAGDGNLVSSGKFPGAPPSYATGNSSRGGAMRDLSDGKIYHTITNGLNLMGPHAGQLLPEQRWQVVMFVRELQKAGQPAPAPATTDSTAAASTSAATTK